MPKFAKKWFAVPPGEIYPVTYRPGEACPDALVDEARALSLLEADEPIAPQSKSGKARS
jgi:hypothetical protein